MQTRNIRNAGIAAAMSILLIGFAAAAAWMAIAPGLSGDATAPLVGDLASVETVGAEASALVEGIRISSDFQFSQPRDPFRPLVTEDGQIVGGGGSVTDPGSSGTVVRLIAVNDLDGILRATVEVNGVQYDVGIGETFAGSFKLVSLTTDSGVFLFGDNAFELTVGQEILK